jgi:hypothetical protein
MTGHNAAMNRIAGLFALTLLLALAGCSSAPSAMNAQDEALTNYGVAIRWSEFTDAWNYVDPALRLQQPLTDLELARFKQLQVTGYDVKARDDLPDGTVVQTVEIRLINKNTQIERTITDHQRWRWDPASKAFWLTTGLPDFTAEPD